MREILFYFLSVYLYQKDEPEAVDPAGSGRADHRPTAQQTRGQGISGENSLYRRQSKNLRVKNYLLNGFSGIKIECWHGSITL